MRVVVVGGGVIGLACAWQLALRGAGVTVLDAAPEAREASWAAAGMLAPHHEAAATDALWRLGAESLGRWEGFAAALGGEVELDYRRNGGLLPVVTDADLQEGESRTVALRQSGVESEWWTSKQLRAREPSLGAQLRGAWCIPGGQVDPRRLLVRLQHACAAAGVALRYGARVAQLGAGAGSGAGTVRMHDGSLLGGDWVVVASGAWTPALAQATGIDLAGEPVKGQMLRLQAPDDILTRYVHSHHAYVVPRMGAGLVVGSTMVEAGFDRSQDPEAIRHLADQARALLPSLGQAAVVEHWTGLRPRLRGGRPVIAVVRSGLILATGHFRNGILLTPATAAAVTALAYGDLVSADAQPFTRIPPSMPP